MILRECKECGLWRHGGPVRPEGTGNEPFMIIARNPGRTELKENRPLVGPAGKFLFACLEELGYARKDFYITNTVKCYTPTGWAPDRTQCTQCSRLWLFDEVELVFSFRRNLPTPSILAFGTEALHLFQPCWPIGAVHGTRHVLGRPGFPTMDTVVWFFYHPAWAIRAEPNKTVFRNDLKKWKESEIQHATTCEHDVSAIQR